MIDKNNHSKIILDLCGGTGSWSKYYNDDETICEIETETDLEGTLMIINDITEYCILNNIYMKEQIKI